MIASPTTYPETHAEIEQALQAHQFECTNFRRAEVLHVIGVGMGGWVAVIGDRANGNYEWVARHEGQAPRYSHSNSGYGCPASALRDGLNERL